MNNLKKGTIAILISSFGFAFMALCIKELGHLPVTQKAFFRNIPTLIISSMMVYAHKERFFGQRHNQPILLARSILGSMGILATFYGVSHLLLGDSSLLGRMEPFITILLAAIFLKERLKGYHYLACLLVFIGLFFIVQPTFESKDYTAYFMSLLGSLLAACAYFILRILGSRNIQDKAQGESQNTIVFYFSFFSSVVFGILMIPTFEPMTTHQILWAALSGLGAILGQYGITIAYRFAPPKDISIFSYSHLFFSMIFGVIFFGELPNLLSWIGYLLVLASAFLIYIKNKSEHKTS